MDSTLFYLSFYVMSFVLVTVVWLNLRLEYRQQSVTVLFWVGILVVYVLPSLGDPFRTEAQATRQTPLIELGVTAVLLRAHAFAIGTSLCYLVTRWLLATQERRLLDPSTPAQLPATLAPARREVKPLVLILAGAAVVSITLAIVAIISTQGWAGLLEGTYQSYRNEANPLLKLSAYYLISAIGAGTFIAWYSGHRAAAVVIATCTVMVFLAGRTRQLLVPAVILFALLMIHRATNWRGRIKLIGWGTVAYVVTLFLQIFRYQGDLISNLRALLEGTLYEQFQSSMDRSGGEAKTRLAYYFFIDPDHGDFPEFGKGLTYRRMALLPVPSGLLGGLKPRDFDEVLYREYLGMPVNWYGGSLHTIFFGNTYANFGWPGMLIGGFWAVVLHLVHRWLTARPLLLRLLIAAPLGEAALMAARGSVYNSSALAFWTVVIALTLYGVSRLVHR